MPTVAKYFFAHDKDNKFLNYGLQANTYYFAFAKKDEFFKKQIGQHFGTSYMDGFGGILQSYAMSNPLTLGIERGLGKTSVAFWSKST